MRKPEAEAWYGQEAEGMRAGKRLADDRAEQPTCGPATHGANNLGRATDGEYRQSKRLRRLDGDILVEYAAAHGHQSLARPLLDSLTAARLFCTTD